jgi:3-hydroxy-9,10-secoandrosta-1,3,5(10)-triene-9,17-dione monooxygenase reductase component
MSAFAPAEFRAAMSRFCSGVVIVTGAKTDQPLGFTAQSFLSLSLEPPLVAVCPGKSSSSWPRIRDTGHFGINMLADNQRDLCRRFASSGSAMAGGGKFAGIDWQRGNTGSPILPGVLAFVDCRFEAEHDAGDHTIAVGRVVDLRLGVPDRLPLLFYRGAYGSYCAADAAGLEVQRE